MKKIMVLVFLLFMSFGVASAQHVYITDIHDNKGRAANVYIDDSTIVKIGTSYGFDAIITNPSNGDYRYISYVYDPTLNLVKVSSPSYRGMDRILPFNEFPPEVQAMMKPLFAYAMSHTPALVL